MNCQAFCNFALAIALAGGLCLQSTAALAQQTPGADTRVEPTPIESDESFIPGQATPQAAVLGCGLCGGIPDIIVIGGWTFFGVSLAVGTAQGGTQGCGTVFAGIILGVIPALLATWVTGPLGPLGSMIGGSIAAALAGRNCWPPLIGGLPGLALGTLGSLLASAFVLQDQGRSAERALIPQEMMIGVVATGTVMAMLGGPLAALGVIVADQLWGAPAPVPPAAASSGAERKPPKAQVDASSRPVDVLPTPAQPASQPAASQPSPDPVLPDTVEGYDY